MKIDITQYKSYKPVLIEKANFYDIDRAIMIGVTSFVPILVIYTFLNEEFGGFDEKITDIIEFYRYDEIVYDKD